METIAYLALKKIRELEELMGGGAGGGSGGGQQVTNNLNYVYNPSTGLWHECLAEGDDGIAIFTMNPVGTTIINGQVLTAIGANLGVANIAALGAITARTHYQVQEVLGYASPGDGGQKRWYFDATSYAVHDGALVVRPNDVLVGSPGRWIAL